MEHAPSDLGPGYDELTDALRREGVPFVVLYGPDAATDPAPRYSASVGIWIPDLPDATDAYDRALAGLKNVPIRPIVHPRHRLHPENAITEIVVHGGRTFQISVRPEPEFAAALADATVIPEEAGPHPVAAAPLRAAFTAAQAEERKSNEEILASEAERTARMWREQEQAFETRVLTLIEEQKAARRAARETGGAAVPSPPRPSQASDLGRGFDEVVAALRSEGVPFVVLYGPEAPTGWGGSRAATIGLWIPDVPEAISGFERARSTLERRPIQPLVTPVARLHPEYGITGSLRRWERDFRISAKPEPEFAAALAGASTIPHEAGDAPVASVELRAAFVAEREASARMLAEEGAPRGVGEMEDRILDLVAEQKAARRKARAEASE